MGVTALLFFAFANWAYDDPFITYRYAHNLARGVGFVYNPGSRVLSTTTPLFTLLLAALEGLWGDLPKLANLVGALCLALGALLLWDLAQTWRMPSVGWVSLVLYPTLPILVSTLGSETPLYLALCLGAFAFYARERYDLAAACAALAVLTRPDGALVPILLASDYLVRQRRIPRWKTAAIFLVPTLAWFGFAGLYFGSPIPVTLGAKQGQGAMAISIRFAPGFVNLFRQYLTLPEHIIQVSLAGLGLLTCFRHGRRWGLFLAWPVLYFTAYAALGVSSYFWYYAPLFPGLLAATGLGLDWLTRRLNSSGLRSAWVVGVALILLGGLQLRNLGYLSEQPDTRYRSYRAVGEWLRANTAPDAQVGTLEIGIIGYYTPNPMVDFTGLIQSKVADQFTAQTTYEDAALWAVDHFRPEYLALHDRLMPRLEASLDCDLQQRFPGEQYGYAHDMVVYACP